MISHLKVLNLRMLFLFPLSLKMTAAEARVAWPQSGTFRQWFQWPPRVLRDRINEQGNNGQYAIKNNQMRQPLLKGFATFWEFSFYGQKKVADYEYHSLFAEKIHFHTLFFNFNVLKPMSFSSKLWFEEIISLNP